MNRQQRYRYEMFVRVRDFGAANAALFPASSPGGQRFAQMAAVVAAIEQELQKRDLARAEAQRVKATTRAKVKEQMKAIALIARRVNRTDPGINKLKMPSRQSTNALLTRARVFATEAGKRQAAFADFGLSPDLLSEFNSLVDQLEQAAAVRMNSRSLRREAQAGVERALADGFTVIHDLDAVVANALTNDPAKFAGWEGARRLEGLGSPEAPPVSTPAPAVPVPAETTGAETGTVPIAADLRRAS